MAPLPAGKSLETNLGFKNISSGLWSVLLLPALSEYCIKKAPDSLWSKSALTLPLTNSGSSVIVSGWQWTNKTGIIVGELLNPAGSSLRFGAGNNEGNKS